ncbi:uncharacterized protein LOC127750489 isoform X2 [Frankliniella occidentalis]|uniref:Uncharacterized protein LOC127750489 isoform X2 n=1 Tax=Frankliniella occidentalis TaxID=133901 RepID=A0A9C6X316_FRAOC|nr:uncharacterized protein LOC127750489 isoform X2 [Frankliniella occidentalis]
MESTSTMVTNLPVPSCAMEEYLSEWMQHMGDRRSTPARPMLKILRLLRESWVAAFMMFVHLLLTAADNITTPKSYSFAARFSTRTLFGYITSFVSYHIISGRRQNILSAFHHSRIAAQALYASGWNQVLWLMKWLLGVMSLSCCFVVVFTVMFVELAIHTSAAALLEQVGHRFSQKQGKYETVRSVRIHVMLLAACQQANAMFGLLLPLYLLGSYAVSVLSTVSVVRGGVTSDMYGMVCTSYIFAFFGPMCFAGERIQDAALGLSTRVYEGPWPEEDVCTRRTRLQIMVCCARPARFMVPGMPVMNLPTCRQGVRSWFQFIQVLINIQSRK